MTSIPQIGDDVSLSEYALNRKKHLVRALPNLVRATRPSSTEHSFLKELGGALHGNEFTAFGVVVL